MIRGYSTPVMRSLTLLALTTSATVAVGQQPDRQRCRDCPPSAEGRAAAEARAAQARDSVRARSVGQGVDIDRLAIELLSTRQFQMEAEQALRLLVSGQVTEENRAQAEQMMRRLRAQIEQAARQTGVLRNQLAALCDRNSKPQGYMGITFSATMQADASGSGAEVFRFSENPTVETVEPGSPAERAGVSKGDEIILIGGQNVVGRDIVFARLLRPGAKLPIRIRREGDTRDVLLFVTQRPPSLDNGCPSLDARIMAAFGDPVPVSAPRPPMAGSVRTMRARSGAVIVRTPAPPSPDTPPAPGARGSRGVVVVAPPAPMVPAVALTTPAPAEGRGSEANIIMFPGTSSAPVVIAGATIIRTNADLRETFGVKSG